MSPALCRDSLDLWLSLKQRHVVLLLYKTEYGVAHYPSTEAVKQWPPVQRVLQLWYSQALSCNTMCGFNYRAQHSE